MFTKETPKDTPGTGLNGSKLNYPDFTYQLFKETLNFSKFF